MKGGRGEALQPEQGCSFRGSFCARSAKARVGKDESGKVGDAGASPDRTGRGQKPGRLAQAGGEMAEDATEDRGGEASPPRLLIGWGRWEHELREGGAVVRKAAQADE